MTASRFRLGVLVVALVLTAAAGFGGEARDLRTVAADPVAVAGTDVGGAPAEFWCSARRPHAADTVVHAEWIDLNEQGIVTARCAAAHPGDAHFYFVTLWDFDPHDGTVERVEWTPLGPWWT